MNYLTILYYPCSHIYRFLSTYMAIYDIELQAGMAGRLEGCMRGCMTGWGHSAQRP